MSKVSVRIAAALQAGTTVRLEVDGKAVDTRVEMLFSNGCRGLDRRWFLIFQANDTLYTSAPFRLSDKVVVVT